MKKCTNKKRAQATNPELNTAVTTNNNEEENTMKTTNSVTLSTISNNSAKEEITMSTTMTNSTTITAAMSTSSKKLFSIIHYNAITNESTIELHSSNMAFRYAISKGLNPEEEFIFVDSYIDKKHEYQTTVWFELCKNGITIENVRYLPLCATASGRKMAQSIWVKAEHLVMFSKHFRHNFKILGTKMEPNKFFTRLGLFFSTSTPIEEVYPNFRIDFDKMHIMADAERNEHNTSDSACFIFDGDNNLPSEAASLRPTKVLAVPVNKRIFLDALGFDPEYKTPWGDTHKISETQVLLSESGEKFISLVKDEAEQVDAIKEAGISVAVRMNKHNSKNVTYQPLQTLNFSEESIAKVERIGVDYISSLSELKNYIKLLPREAREAVSIYPQLVKDAYLKKAGQTAYRKQKMTLRGAALPLSGKFFAICPDPIDLFGGNGLKAGQCSCEALPEGKVVMLRYPHTAAASWVVLDNIHQRNGITDPNVMVLNNYDETLRRLGGADYDGDKVEVIIDEEVKSIILTTLEEMGNPTEMPNTPEGHAVKMLFDKQSANNIKTAYFTGITNRSQIGSVSNKLSAAYANLFDAAATGDAEAVADAKEAVEYWQKKVEITVDIEKHGDTNLSVPESVKNMNKLMPNFIKYAKIAKFIDKPVKEVIDTEKYALRENHPLEKYSQYINNNTPLAKEFSVDIEGDFFFNNLMFDADLPKLNTSVFKPNKALRNADGSILKDEKGNILYGNGGRFDKIVFANSDELRRIAKSRGISNGKITEMRKALIERLMSLYAVKYACSLEQVYNLIVYYVYSIDNDAAADVYKRVFWECLHEYAERALTERFGTAALEFEDGLEDVDDDAEDEDEEDIDF